MKKRNKSETNAPPLGDRQLTMREAAEVLRLSTQGDPRESFELAGVADSHAHRFRDTFAVDLLMAGVLSIECPCS
jgi:hypothetical protein